MASLAHREASLAHRERSLAQYAAAVTDRNAKSDARVHQRTLAHFERVGQQREHAIEPTVERAVQEDGCVWKQLSVSELGSLTDLV